jgi:1,2-dihydroxy-3-keto-5-methylthiopentene dioxygenase
MSRLRIFDANDGERPRVDTGDYERMQQLLGEAGVRFERWRAAAPLADDAGPDAILAAYAGEIDRLKAEGGYQSVDVVRMRPDHPERAAIRGKFLEEHTHAEDEVRFFVEGSGLFCLHIGDSVHLVTCERDDLISVPAGTRHWFDMGEHPRFAAVRLFINPSGWVAQFTGDGIARRFPRHDGCAPS